MKILENKSKYMKNYKVLMSLRLLKNILATFIDSFLVLYFLTISENNIIPFGIYKLIAVSTIFLTMFLLRNLCKSEYRKFILIFGILFDLLYFLAIIILQEKVIDYAYLLGILYGIEEGLYYSVFNSFESDGVDNKNRAKYYGNLKVYNSILSVIFPIFFGSIIAKTGFIKSLFIVIIIVILRVLLAFFFEDKNIPKENKTNLKVCLKIIKEEKEIKQLFKINFYDGLTYSNGAFKNIITIYIIKVFSDSFSLGIFTSIFSLIAGLMGYLFAHFIKRKEYPYIIRFTMTFTICSLIILIIKCNVITIIVFNLFQTISNTLLGLINDYSKANLSNIKSIRTKYKIEYYIFSDFYLFLGRVLSYVLFILIAFIGEIFIIPFFIMALILLTYNSIKLQKLI